MAQGLILTISEFKKLPMVDQLSCLYENQCRTLSYMTNFQYHKKIFYSAIAVLSGAIIYIFKLLMGGKQW